MSNYYSPIHSHVILSRRIITRITISQHPNTCSQKVLASSITPLLRRRAKIQLAITIGRRKLRTLRQRYTVTNIHHSSFLRPNLTFSHKSDTPQLITRLNRKRSLATRSRPNSISRHDLSHLHALANFNRGTRQVNYSNPNHRPHPQVIPQRQANIRVR